MTTTNSVKDIRVLIFEDNKNLREGMAHILNASPGFDCVGMFANCNKLIEHIRNCEPDVILMDIQMPGMTGIEAASIVSENFPDISILMQTIFEDESKVFAAICAGASGYILKNTPPVQFLEAIKEAAAGGSPITPSIASKVLRMFKEHNPHAQTGMSVDLSVREKEILTLLTDGLSYKMIAAKLFISYETVHSHVRKIYQKLHVNSVNEAVSKALRNKLV